MAWARSIRILAGKELRDALRNRWFVAYGVSLVSLSLGLAFLALAGAGYGQVAGFGRTAASMVNLMMLLVPLTGLTLGAQALAGERERGSLEFWLAQPVDILDFYLGKVVGLGLALAAAVLVSFGAAGLVLGAAGSYRDPGAFLWLVELTLLLGWASLGVGIAISAGARRLSTALSLAVAAWLILGLAGSLGLMGTAVVLRISPGWLLAAAFINPLESYRVAALYLLSGSAELLGPAGLYAADTLGSYLPLAFQVSLALWIPAALGVGYLGLAREVRR